MHQDYCTNSPISMALSTKLNVGVSPTEGARTTFFSIEQNFVVIVHTQISTQRLTASSQASSFSHAGTLPRPRSCGDSAQDARSRQPPGATVTKCRSHVQGPKWVLSTTTPSQPEEKLKLSSAPLALWTYGASDDPRPLPHPSGGLCKGGGGGWIILEMSVVTPARTSCDVRARCPPPQARLRGSLAAASGYL